MTVATGPFAERGIVHAADAVRPDLSVVPTKLVPPYRRPGIIDRPRLVACLRAVTTPIVAVVAPAGYGKSTIVAQWTDASSRPTAWLSADGRDSDAATLVRGLAAAIDRVTPLPDDTLAAALAPRPTVWTMAVPRLWAAIAATPALRLVVDDVDRIDDREAIDVILTLADQLHEHGQLVLVGRSLEAVPQARLVARGLMTTIGRDDLALDDVEVRGVLSAAGVDLSDQELRRLADRTEGWAAGVYLSSLAQTEPRDGVRSVAPTAPERQVEEFLRFEVLEAISPADADLLLRSSVLDRLSGPLCDAVLDRTGSGPDLDRIERGNLFVIPLDEDRQWFRLHHLLGDVLRAELERRDPDEAAALRRRAAAWHASHQQLETALEYAMAGGDEDRAAVLTVAVGQAAMNAGRTETVRRWFTWFDDRGTMLRQPKLAAYAAMVFAMDGDEVRAERWADAAERPVSAPPEAGPDAGLRAISRVMLARDGLAAMRADAELAFRTVPPGDPWRVAALGSFGLACRLTGESDLAGRYLRQAVARFDEGSVANNSACIVLAFMATDALGLGDRAAAEAHVRKARSILMANGLAETALAVPIDALDARIAMLHGATEQARADLAHAQRLRPYLGRAIPWLAVRARLDLARAHLAVDDPGGARTVIREIRDILLLRPEMGTLLDELTELEARLESIRGGIAGVSTLTLAELRLLPLLTTHLSFREIGERLYISQNTVKTQAISIYRKLDATSRSEAIERAMDLGLLEPPVPTDRFIPVG